MEIKRSGGARPVSRVSPQAGAKPVEAAPAVAPADAVSFGGIPEAELTPRVREALTALMREVADLRRELADSQKRMAELEELASTDPLLGVLNRRAFVAELGRALAMVERYGHPSSLVFIDLDDLKRINDGHGHAAGDEALKHAASVIASNIRQTDVFGRLGGDEFALILTNTPRTGAEAKARALKLIVGAEPFREGLYVGVSCGVVELTKETSAEDALIAADKVMYEEKRKR